MAKNGSDLVAVLEYLDRKTAFKPPKSGRKTRKLVIPDEFDLISYVQKKEEEVERWKKYLKDKEKLEKKDTKPEYKGPNLKFVEWYIIGILSYPLVGHIWQLATTVK
jgi:hypothetical protein